MKHLIIGGSSAGISAAKTLRQKDADAQISVVTMDTQIFSRCMLHRYLDRTKTTEQLRFVPEDFFTTQRINLLQGERVIAVLPAEKQVLLADGTPIGYDKLLIASGASYFVPPIAHLRAGKNVYGFRALSDADKLNRLIVPGKRCVIIGSGLVGLDATYALCKRGVQCTVMEMAPRLCPIQLDDTAAATYQALFEQAGCRFYLGDAVVNATPDHQGNIVSIELQSGVSLPCDFVLVSAGISPNVAFLADSGIAVERSVLVDDYLATSMPDIWAAGDVTGIAGIWFSAAKQGEIAARNMLGEQVPFDDRFARKNTMHFFECNTLSIGREDPQPDDEVILRESRNQYEKYTLRDGVLVYALVQGNISNKGFLEQLVKRKISLKGIDKPVWQLSYADFFQYEQGTGKFLW